MSDLQRWSPGEHNAVVFCLALSEGLLVVGLPFTALTPTDWQWFPGSLLLFLACQRLYMLLMTIIRESR